MYRIFEGLFKNKFFRSVFVLAGGAAFAQAISVLILPFLTRLYSPDDFGVLAIYVALLGIVSSVACLRFEVAIPIPSKDEEAISLLALALCSTVLISVMVAVVVLSVPHFLAEQLQQPRLEAYLWLLPIGTALSGTYGAFLFWSTRKKYFSEIARTRLSQSVGSAAVQVGMGVYGFGPVGLIVGYVVNVGAGSLGLSRRLITVDRYLWSHVSLSELRRTFGNYSQYPRLSTIEALANNAAVQLPILIISASALGREAGYLLLAMRVMQAPVGLVGQAVSQVFFSRAPDEFRAGRMSLFTSEILNGLVKVSVGPLCCLGLVAPGLFEVVFGSEWRRAGELVLWMTPWIVFQALSSPLSMTLHVTGHQALALRLQLFGLALRVTAVIVVGEFFREYMAEAYAVSGSVFYLAYLWVIAKAASMPFKAVLGAFLTNVKVILGWVGFGLVAAFCLNTKGLIF